MASKLSETTKNMGSNLMADPQKLENIISMLRTVAPLATPQTITKVNTYLPPFEKLSTLIGMCSFLNKAQTFRPIEPMSTKSPADKLSALMKNGNIPLGKMITQPIIANNMEKIMGTVVANMLKSNDLNDLLKNANINEMLSSISKNTDLSSVIESFMPAINGMKSDSISNETMAAGTLEKSPEKVKFKNESCLPYDEHRNSCNERKNIQRPIRIKQKRRKIE